MVNRNPVPPPRRAQPRPVQPGPVQPRRPATPSAVPPAPPGMIAVCQLCPRKPVTTLYGKRGAAWRAMVGLPPRKITVCRQCMPAGIRFLR